VERVAALAFQRQQEAAWRKPGQALRKESIWRLAINHFSLAVPFFPKAGRWGFVLIFGHRGSDSEGAKEDI
jgi:hypothetical protein